MTTEVKIEGTFENGKPIEELSRLIALREKYLSTELSENATTATALNVVTSLKTLTLVSPWQDNAAVPAASYEIKESHTLYPGFAMPKGQKGGTGAKVVLRTRPNNSGPKSHIRPVMLITPSARNALTAKVYVITTANKHDRFTKNVNAPATCWYVLAYNIDSARMWAEKRVKRIFAKEGGMARFALSKAQARIYDKAGSEPIRKTGGSKQWQLAADAAKVTKTGFGFGSGKYGIELFDSLNYSLLSLKGGPGAMDTAIMKAANRTAGIINAHLDKYGIDVEKLPTPFPEISGK